MVSEKQTKINDAIATRKIKFDKASNPSHLANDSRGPGIMAIMINMTGKRSHATEFLMDKEFFFRLIIMTSSKKTAAIDISICMLVIFPPP